LRERYHISRQRADKKGLDSANGIVNYIAPRHKPFPRFAIIKKSKDGDSDVNEILIRLEQLEGEITYHAPPPPGIQPFRYVPGHVPILVSAPHGAAHHRDGRFKQEDEYSAAFARLVGERTGAHVLYAWAQSDGDPNWDRQSPYKNRLRHILIEHSIRFVLDIHGMSNRHQFGIAVGTMCGASCRQHHEALIAGALIASGFRPTTAQEARDFPALAWDCFVLNHRRFTGGMTSHTITRFAAEGLGIHAAQFELCADLRIVRRRNSGKRPGDFRGSPTGIVQAVSAFDQLVQTLTETTM
jgi:hypothetical protein